jgi:hypothetical protein
VQVALKATTRQCILHTQRSPDQVWNPYAQFALLNRGLIEMIHDVVDEKEVASFLAMTPLR